MVKAYPRDKNQPVAIKYIKNAFNQIEGCKRVLREVCILRNLTKMENNIFTVKLVDVIIPEADESTGIPPGIFIIMTWYDKDLKAVFTELKPPAFDMGHAKIIIYNLLCALHYLQTANIIHRDIKPSNIMLTDNCGVKICDFGLARTMPTDLADADAAMDAGQESTAAPEFQRLNRFQRTEMAELLEMTRSGREKTTR